MHRHEKLLLKVLRGQSDANIPFNDLCSLLLHSGFEERVKGSHHIFRKEKIKEKGIYTKMETKPKYIRFGR